MNGRSSKAELCILPIMSNPPPADPARFAGVTLNDSLCTVIRQGVVIRLTERQFAMLQLLLTRAIVTTPEFAALSRAVYGIDDSTVRGYVMDLRRKLKAVGLAIETHRARGFVLREL